MEVPVDEDASVKSIDDDAATLADRVLATVRAA